MKNNRWHKYCPGCEDEVWEEWAYCPYCGANLFKDKPQYPKPRFVQLLNPKSKRYVKIDRRTGSIVGYTSNNKPYKDVDIISK
jgi:hypothetical protein